MRVICVNGWLGRLNSPLANFVKQEKPDIVCLQEAFAPKTKSPYNFHDQYAYIDELIKVGSFKYWLFSPSWAFEMGGAIIQVGNIILSKHPLLHSTELHAYGKYSIKDSDDNQRTNIRVLQTCRVELPGDKKLSLANYQGYLPGADPIGNEISVSTIQKVAGSVRQLLTPLIFCADLNITKESPAFGPIKQLNLRNLIDENNIKTTLSPVHRAPKKDRDSVACDFIFISADVKVNNFQVPETIVSDHKPMILDFDI